MKKFYAFVLFLFTFACGYSQAQDTHHDGKNLLADYSCFTSDSMVQVIIEIPVGSNEKWEFNKANGLIEWQLLENGEGRMIHYLGYPANYGFIPQTLVPAATGGDGDPVDVFVLGSSMNRGSVVKVKIVGMINILDDNESDPKLLAVHADDQLFNIHSYKMLMNKYPGVVEIIKLWLLHYKGADRIKIVSEGDEKDAMSYIKEAHKSFINNKNE
jgi:inorganic pyrophosphatase